MKFLGVFIFLAATFIIGAKIIVVPETDIHDCSPDGRILSDYWDLSDFELIQENDTHVYINGTFKFLKEMRAPFGITIFSERYERGQWSLHFKNSFNDFCSKMFDPLYPIYDITKDLSPCPRPAGSAYEFNMKHLTANQVYLDSIPMYYTGRWRMNTFCTYHGENGQSETICFRTYADVHSA